MKKKLIAKEHDIKWVYDDETLEEFHDVYICIEDGLSYSDGTYCDLVASAWDTVNDAAIKFETIEDAKEWINKVGDNYEVYSHCGMFEIHPTREVA